MSLLEKTIAMIQAASTIDDAFCVFKSFLNESGYNNACYTLLTDHPSIGKLAYHGLASDYPEDWLSYYREQNYQLYDPVWLHSLDNFVPFFWKDAVEKNVRDHARDPQFVNRSVRVMDQAADAGVADGIGMSFVNRVGEMAGFGISRQQSARSHDYQELSSIYLAGTVFHDKFLSLHQVTATPEFSQREKDIMCWAAEGKSDWEIATILGIKHPTVRYHWKNIFAKFDVSNRLLATSMAIRKNIIQPQTIQSLPAK